MNPTALLRQVARGLEHVGRRNEDLAIAAVLPSVIDQLHEPVAFVGFLRESWQPMTCRVVPIKTGQASARFGTLLRVLGSGIPPLDHGTAVEIGLVADGFRARRDEKTWWSVSTTDVGLNFVSDSSFARKGRILSVAVRLMRSEAGLEIGTAYGMSALFIATAQALLGHKVRLVTIENGEPQYSLARAMLAERYPSVVCEKGLSQDVLRGLLVHQADYDFVFHDGGHSRDHYVNDFAAMKPLLRPGAVVLFDDIRWARDPAGTYKGWREVVDDPGVASAVELDGVVGLLAMK